MKDTTALLVKLLLQSAMAANTAVNRNNPMYEAAVAPDPSRPLAAARKKISQVGISAIAITARAARYFPFTICQNVSGLD